MAGTIDGIDAADLNFSDHLEQLPPKQMGSLLAWNGLSLNGLAMRYYGRRDFVRGP